MKSLIIKQKWRDELFKSIVLLFIGLFLSLSIVAISNAGTVEEEAKKVSNWLAEKAPIQMDSSTYLVGSFSNGKKVIVIGEIDLSTIGVDRQTLISSKISIAREIKNYTKNGLCSDSRTKPFIRMGGVFKYRYRFSDGTPFFSYEVTSRDCI